MVRSCLLSCLHYKLNKFINSSLSDVFGPHASANPCSDLCARSSTQTIKVMTHWRCLFGEQNLFFLLSFKVVLIISSWKSGNRWGVCCVVGSCYAMRKTERLGHLETPGRDCWKVVCFHFFPLLIFKDLVSNDSAKVITCSCPMYWGNETISRWVAIAPMLLCQEQIPQKFFCAGSQSVSLTFHNQLQSIPAKMF